MPKGVYERKPRFREGADQYRPITTNGKRVASAEYNAWQHMRNRCLNFKTKDYPYYGGRGISICARWDSFNNFLEDMGGVPSKWTLDRVDGNGNYCKENCRWATRETQSRNRAYCKLFRGKQNWEWASELGISTRTFAQRLRFFERGRITESTLFGIGKYPR